MSRADDLFDRLVAGGEPEVFAFIAEPVTEELFLDYKRSADNGTGGKLHQNDRSNLAKAISGFGNSEGGVIVWGIDCRNDPVRGDVPSGAVHIHDPVRFKSWLEQATTGLTVPPHRGVRHHAISQGFVVTLIPSGMHAPYQVVPELAYYIRSGSNFARAPHAVLAGMFGRRPQPSVKLRYFVDDTPSIIAPGSVKTQVMMILRNYGRGVARDVFFNLSIKSHPGRACKIEFKPSEEREVWSGRISLAKDAHMAMRSGFILAPEQDINPMALEITLTNPIERDFSFEGMCGSADGEPYRFAFKSEIADIIKATDNLFRAPAGARELPYLCNEFNKTFFKNIQNI